MDNITKPVSLQYGVTLQQITPMSCHIM